MRERNRYEFSSTLIQDYKFRNACLRNVQTFPPADRVLCEVRSTNRHRIASTHRLLGRRDLPNSFLLFRPAHANPYYSLNRKILLVKYDYVV